MKLLELVDRATACYALLLICYPSVFRSFMVRYGFGESYQVHAEQIFVGVPRNFNAAGPHEPRRLPGSGPPSQTTCQSTRQRLHLKELPAVHCLYSSLVRRCRR